jgi:uncharacterized protein DUF4340
VNVRWRQVTIAYLVLAGLGAEYWFVERPRTPRAESVPVRLRFVPVGADDVREVRLSRGGRTVVSRREQGGWVLIEPAGASVPPDLIGAFTNALAEADVIARVGTESDAALDFGFDGEATRVEVRGDSGEPVVLTIGGENPTGTAVYARRQGATDVVLIGRNIRYYEDLIFQALASERAPAAESGAPVGG